MKAEQDMEEKDQKISTLQTDLDVKIIDIDEKEKVMKHQEEIIEMKEEVIVQHG